jgi:hypothetical protein
MTTITGRYEGDCKKGKANGSGKAEGTDQYVGEFKDGLPHGKGIYRWKNGNLYEGAWLNGKRDGDGGMAYKRDGKTDSVITGFWKKDMYVGKYEKPYIVYNRSSLVSKGEVEVKFSSSIEKEITVLISNASGNTPTVRTTTGNDNLPTLRGDFTPMAQLTDISIFKGFYGRLIELPKTNRQTVYKLEKVNFPFRAKFSIGNQEVEIEFLEAGKYSLDITLSN